MQRLAVGMVTIIADNSQEEKDHLLGDLWLFSILFVLATQIQNK